jgi:hypothetical protein
MVQDFYTQQFKQIYITYFYYQNVKKQLTDSLIIQ